MTRSVGVLLFPDFELLDVFGPLEMLGMLDQEFAIRLVSESAPEIASTQGPRSRIDDHFADDIATGADAVARFDLAHPLWAAS